MAKIVKLSEKPNSTQISTVKELAKFIKYQRTKLNLTRQNVALMCGINYKTLENIENANEKCDIGKVLHVCQMLGIKLNTKLEEL